MAGLRYETVIVIVIIMPLEIIFLIFISICMEKNNHDVKMTTARYERKSLELPVAFDQSSDKDAFVEDCKVVNVSLIVVNPL